MPDAQTINRAFREFLERSCLALAGEVPEFPTQMGMFEVAGEAVPQDRFTAIDADARAARQALLDDLAAEMERFALHELDPADKLSADIVRFTLDYAHERGLVGRQGGALQQNEYLIRPSVGLQSELPLFLTDLHPFRHEGDAEDYVRRLTCIAPQIEEATEQLRMSHARQAAPPGILIDDVIDEVRRFLDVPADASTLYETLALKTGEISSLDSGMRNSLLSDAKREICENTYPAYESLLGMLEGLAPEAAEAPGMWRLPDGDAWYDFQLRAATTTDLSADDIHQLGIEETERLEDEILHACRDVGIQADDIREGYRQLDERNARPRADTPENRKAIVDTVESLIADIEPQLPDLFHTLPKGAITVKPMPHFAEANRNQSYQPPSIDGSRAGFFEINVGQLLNAPVHELAVLVYHEIFPGHHLQISLAQETRDLPSLRRIITFDAYIEGWAKYAELMPALHGLNDDPWFRITRMRRELISTINLALDTGIHRLRWSKSEAMAFFAQHSGMDEAFCRYIVHRSASVPAQMCAYKIGMLKVMQLRQKTEQSLGDRFDVRDFHDSVLRDGAVPLTILEQLVDARISGQH